MTPESAASGVLFSLGLAALVVAFLRVYVPAMEAKFRDEVFHLRRELFSLAADGKVAFSDPAYVRLRGTMNGMLRFIERLTFPRLVVFFIATKDEPDVEPDLDDLIQQIPDEATRERLLKIRTDVGLTLIAHLFLTSPTLLVCFVVVALAAAAAWVFRGGPFKTLRELAGTSAETLAEKVSNDDCFDGMELA